MVSKRVNSNYYLILLLLVAVLDNVIIMMTISMSNSPLTDDNNSNNNTQQQQQYETLSLPITFLKSQKEEEGKKYESFLFGENHMMVFTFNSSWTNFEHLHERKILIVEEHIHSAFEAVLQMLNEENFSHGDSTQKIVPTKTKISYVARDVFWGDLVDQFDFFACDSATIQQTLWHASNGSVKWSEIHLLEEFIVPTFIRIFKDKPFQFDNLTREDSLKILSLYSGDYNINYSFNYIRSIFNFTQTYYENQFKFLNYYLNYQITNLNLISNISSLITTTFSQKPYELSEVYCYSALITSYYKCGYDTEFIALSLSQIFNYIVMAFGVLTYMALATVFKTKAIKRRLATPYVIPLAMIIGALLFSPIVTDNISFLRMIIMIFISSYSICLYAITIIRLYYVKYIYHILKKIPENHIKIHKLLSSDKFGLIASQILSIISSLFWLIILIPYLSDIQRFYTNAIYLFLGIFVFQILSAALLGIIVIIIDFIMHWKTIKRTGNFFSSFEDPFYIRQDVVSYTIIEISLIIVLACSISDSSYDVLIVAAFFRSVAFIVMYFLSGFTAIIFEWIRLIKSRNNVRQEVEEGVTFTKIQIEDFMLDDNFKFMFMSYCEKEHSLENAIMFENLGELERKSKSNGGLVSEEDLTIFVREHFSATGKFEANLSSNTKLKVLNLVALNQDIPFSTLKQVVEYDLLLNMWDTFDRLCVTTEYKRWQLTKDLQKRASMAIR